jgi:hypothetical protein
MARGDYLARTAGGFSPQDMNIQPAQGPVGQPFSPQDMNIQPAQPPAQPVFSPQDMNIQPAQGPVGQPFSPQDMNIQPAQPPAPSPTIGTDDEGKGLVETLLSNTVVANLLKGAQSTDRFFNNLTEKGVDGLTPEDKVILANLIGRGGLDTIDLNKYTTDDVDFEELGKRFTEAASGLENKDYESLVDGYLSNKPTGIDSLTTMGSDLFNLFGDPRLRRDDKSLTLEGLQKELGPEGIAYLKATNPKLYYSFTDPQTSGGLEELAQFDLSTLGGSPEDRRLSARVMAAREATSGQGGGGQAGIANISIPQTGQANIIDPTNQYGLFIGKPGPFIGNFVDSDGDGVDDRFQTGPGQPSSQPSDMKKPLPTTGIPQAVGVPAALNYANIAPQFTGYTNQGVSPMLGDYYGNLRRFYG